MVAFLLKISKKGRTLVRIVRVGVMPDSPLMQATPLQLEMTDSRIRPRGLGSPLLCTVPYSHSWRVGIKCHQIKLLHSLAQVVAFYTHFTHVWEHKWKAVENPGPRFLFYFNFVPSTRLSALTLTHPSSNSAKLVVPDSDLMYFGTIPIEVRGATLVQKWCEKKIRAITFSYILFFFPLLSTAPDINSL